MSEKKERKKKTKKEVEPIKDPEPEINTEKQQQNMITFNPATDVSIKLGILVNTRNLLINLIDNHPELILNSDEVIRLGTNIEDINRYIRENALPTNSTPNSRQ